VNFQESPGSITVFQFVISGNDYIFVGNDSNVVSANAYFATNGNGGNPQPSGGTVSATSSDTSDTAAVTNGNPPEVKFTTKDQSSKNGDRTLTFKYTLSSGASTSQEMNATARQFAYLTNNDPSNTCTLGYGTSQTYTYTIYTHPDHEAVAADDGLDGTPVTESFNPTVECGTVTGNGSINANGQFTDLVASGCSSSPLTCSFTTTQSLAIAGYQVRTNKLAFSADGVTYTNNGPTQ
jgi:hypothetical protein